MVHIKWNISHKKEHTWVSVIEVGEPRAYYTERSKSEKQLLYINTYISNLEEKAMAPQLQYSCLENPMDGGAW